MTRAKGPPKGTHRPKCRWCSKVLGQRTWSMCAARMAESLSRVWRGLWGYDGRGFFHSGLCAQQFGTWSMQEPEKAIQVLEIWKASRRAAA